MVETGVVRRAIAGICPGLRGLWRGARGLCVAWLVLYPAMIVWPDALLLILVQGAVAISLVVAWHRGRLSSKAGAVHWRDAGLVLRYFAVGFAISLLWWGPMAVGNAIFLAAFPALLSDMLFSEDTVFGLRHGAMVVVPLMLTLIGAWVALRVSPVLPAMAVGETLGVREAWRRTRGMTGTMVATLALILAPIVGVILALVLYGDPLVDTVGGRLVMWVGEFVGSVVTASAVTELYRHLRDTA